MVLSHRAPPAGIHELCLIRNSSFALDVCFDLAILTHVNTPSSVSVLLSEPSRTELTMRLRACCVYSTGLICILLLIAGIAMVLSEVFQKLLNNRIKEVSVRVCVLFICLYHIITCILFFL